MLTAGHGARISYQFERPCATRRDSSGRFGRTSAPRLPHRWWRSDGPTNGYRAFHALRSQSEINAQIAAPQRATNQKIESQRNTSSRFIVDARCWFSREMIPAVRTGYPRTRTRSCYCAFGFDRHTKSPAFGRASRTLLTHTTCLDAQ